nr:OmpA family protein [Vibrio coralliirubri]
MGVQVGYQSGLDSAYVGEDPTGTSWGGNVGVQLNKNWSVALGYHNLQKLKADLTGVEVYTQFLDVTARYDWSLVDKWAVYGSAGLAIWQMEKSASNSTYDAVGLSPKLEAGLSYQLSSNFDANIGYQYLQGIGESSTEVGEYDNQAFIAGLTWRFGSKDVDSLDKFELGSARPQVSLKDKTHQSVNEVARTSSCGDFDKSNLGPRAVYFKVGNAGAIDAEDLSHQLQQIANQLCEQSSLYVEVKGFASPEGDESFNLKLSEKRVKVVIDKLLKKGVALSRIHGYAFGEDANSTDRNDARRVELHLF